MQSAHLQQRILRASKYAIPVLIIAALSLFQVPYSFGIANQCFQIPKIYQAVAPTSYPGDPLVQSLQNYYSVFFPVITALWQTLGVSLETVYLVLFVLLRIWIVIGFLLIACKLVRPYWARVFVTVCATTTHWAFAGTFLGMDFLLGSQLTHTDVAFAANLSGLAALLFGLPLVATLFAGLGLYLNVLSGAHFCVFLVVFLLFSWRGWPRKSIAAILLLLIISIPLAVRLLPAAESSGATFWTYLPKRFDWHFFFTVDGSVCFAVLAVALILVLGKRVLPPAGQRLCIVALVSIVAMVVLNLLGVYILKFKPLVVIQPLRMEKWVYVALVIVLPVYLWKMFGNEDRVAGKIFLALVAGVFMMGPLVPAGLLGILLAIAFLTNDALPYLQPARSRVLVAILALVSVLALTPIGRGEAFGLREVLLVVFVAVIASAFVIVTLRSRWRSFALGGVVVSIALAQALWVCFDLPTGTPHWYQGCGDQAFADVAEWARENTSSDTQFITPPYVEGWRCLSQRTTLVEWKDGAAMLWSDDYGPVWWHRLASVNCNVEASVPDRYEVMTVRYQSLSPQQLARAAHSFGIDSYVVMPDSWPFSAQFPEAYANSKYRVYAIRTLESRGEAGQQ